MLFNYVIAAEISRRRMQLNPYPANVENMVSY